jgi:hypothetical protein
VLPGDGTDAHAFHGEVTQKSQNQSSLMMLREGKIALDGVIISTVPFKESAWKERTRKTTTMTHIHNAI